MRLALVVAHPDDDTYGASGSVALHAEDPGFHLTVIHVTSGEQGEIADPSLATPQTLGAVREAEDRASWVALGRRPDRQEFLRFPDGGVAEVPAEELSGAIEAILRETEPDVVVTFGPEGITGHDDHIATGAATTAAFHSIRQSEEGVARLAYAAIPESRLRWLSDKLVERGLDPIDPTAPFQPRGVPDEAIDVQVDCGPVWRRKFAALQEHKSQGGASAFPEDLLADVLGSEAFVIAWPPREPGALSLKDLFEGL